MELPITSLKKEIDQLANAVDMQNKTEKEIVKALITQNLNTNKYTYASKIVEWVNEKYQLDIKNENVPSSITAIKKMTPLQTKVAIDLITWLQKSPVDVQKLIGRVFS